MKRYTGEDLPTKSSIAVIANDAIGNFVVATPMLQMLRAKFPDAKLVFFGGRRTRELQAASDLYDDNVELHGSAPTDAVNLLQIHAAKYHLVINFERTALAMMACAVLGSDGYVCGPCMDNGSRGNLPFPETPEGDLWRDEAWIDEHLTKRHPFLQSGFMGEILARLAHLSGDVPRYRVPSKAPAIAVPDVLFSASASLPDKIWPEANWIQVIRALHGSGRTMGLIGAPPKVGAQHWMGGGVEEAIAKSGMVQDLRGQLTLPEVVGALAMTNLVFTLDNGILHLACATDTPTVGLFRYGIHRLWAPPVSNLKVIVPMPGKVVGDIPAENAMRALGISWR